MSVFERFSVGYYVTQLGLIAWGISAMRDRNRSRDITLRSLERLLERTA